MSDKAKTLPRARRDKSPSPSSKSFSSLKTATVGKINSFRALKNPLLRKKKNKKTDSLTSVSADSSEPPTGSSTQDLNDTPELPEDPVAEPDATSTPTTAALDAVQPTQEKLKNPKKPKPPIKKIGKGILNKLKGKNESSAIVIDTALDLRRGGGVTARKMIDGQTDENTPATEQAELENGDVGEMKVISKDEWSTAATQEKVRKLSRLEIQDSMYNEEFEGDGLPDPLTPEDEAFVGLDQPTTNPSTPESITANGNTPGTPLSFDKKSPSTIKKEIMSSINSAKTRKTSEPMSNGSKNARMTRKISMQARNSTDKNELLFKILVIGELGTGKTSIIKRYVHQFFSQHYRATIGVDFALKVLQWDSDSLIRLQLWDIAGQERFGNMTRVYYKEAVGAFIVFDVTRVSTFEAVTKWKQDLDAKVQLANGETIPCVLLANKCDQPKEGIVNNPNKMDEFCKENQFVTWFETSARDNINIDEATNSLVAKIVQNEQKRQEEKETTNGTGVVNISLENGEPTKSKICGAC